MARKIFIYSSEEVKKMSAGNKLEGTLVSIDSEVKSEA